MPALRALRAASNPLAGHTLFASLLVYTVAFTEPAHGMRGTHRKAAAAVWFIT